MEERREGGKEEERAQQKQQTCEDNSPNRQKVLVFVSFLSSPLTGRPGGLGRVELCVSPSAPSRTGRPKIASSSLASGGGMG